MTAPSTAFIGQLEEIIHERLRTPSDNSYTCSLAAAGTQRIAQKVGEEAVELALASVGGKQSDVLDEAADLIYHLLLLLNVQQLSLADVAAKLEQRHLA